MHKICKENFFGFFWPLSCLQKIHAVQETQSVSIHDVLSAQGFAMHYIGRFQTRSANFKFSDLRESFAAKQKDRLLSFLILNVIEAKIFHHVFLEGHNVWENNRY